MKIKKSKSMCGIFGGSLGKTETQNCLNHLHRGNDGTKVVEWEKYGVSFGFMRHSIIAPDDASSMQPIVSDTGKTALVMNGEIFNYQSLKKDLLKKGFVFKSKGDAEVLLNLYREKGDRFCDDLDSMYAAAIFDYEHEYPRILIFRDWIGEEPLHYIYNKEKRQFIFSSEIKGFLGLDNYNFDDIQALEPGTIFEVNLSDFSSRQWKYYELPVNSSKFPYNNAEAIGVELRKRLEQVSEERIIADVPVCCLLSGGVDSIVTTYLVNKLLKKNRKNLTLYTFHIEEEPIVAGTDLYHARIAAKALGLEKNLIEVHISRKDAIEALPEVIYSLEDKRLKDFNVYPAIYNYFLAKRIAKDGFKVVFNGEGSDELHGSYGSWGSFKVEPEEITKPEFRLKMTYNLHKGVLMRTSKVMMYAGPLEMRTFFLSRKVAEYILNIPPAFLRDGDVWKLPLVNAFKDVIPEHLLRRPKARPQDSTGIMALTPLILERFKEDGKTDQEIFETIFKQFYVKKSASH
ncbi:MAG: asparagine synthase-related protein [Candidatus Pacebacteria bacterium]|nr:asparagine synthase-related protein [Candidatus Paceibacterota bacterium]